MILVWEITCMLPDVLFWRPEIPKRRGLLRAQNGNFSQGVAAKDLRCRVSAVEGNRLDFQDSVGYKDGNPGE